MSLCLNYCSTHCPWSLRQAVVPPYLMLMPFLDVPEEISIEGQTAFDEDGVHGCVYRLRANAPFEGVIAVGFRDLQTGEVTHRKVIALNTVDL